MKTEQQVIEMLGRKLTKMEQTLFGMFGCDERYEPYVNLGGLAFRLI